MNGLELSRAYYEECGRPVLERDFSSLLPYLCVGLVGEGSERFGFDDEISRDHDFEPGFCIFLPCEEIVDRRSAFLLERAYAKLPKSFRGFDRQPLSPVGGNRTGVIRTADFYLAHAGTADGELSAEEWLKLPDGALAEATNGEIFSDEYGEFSRIREKLLDMPADIRKKRLAGHLLYMAQTGQYNYPRCLAHGEKEAAQTALHLFVDSALHVTFLLHKKYMPYYKWSFRALRALPGTGELVQALSVLLLENEKEPALASVLRITADALREQGYITEQGDDLARFAYTVNDTVTDGRLRNLPVLSAV